jgi:hypothetical protein
VIQRVAATVVGTLILWFVWWFFGVLLVMWLSYASDILGGIASVLWWIGVVAIPPLLWFRFKHVS